MSSRMKTFSVERWHKKRSYPKIPSGFRFPASVLLTEDRFELREMDALLDGLSNKETLRRESFVSGNAASFIGNIPEEYDRGMGPMIFVDYAADIARRVAHLAPAHVLEMLRAPVSSPAGCVICCPKARF
jgi:hypothetical protein